VVFLGIGALFLLMLVPLGELAVEGGGAIPEFVTGLGSLLTESNTISYNIGQAVLSFGGVFLCWLLFRTGLIPRAPGGAGRRWLRLARGGLHR
jgi:Domain of unknown function (DUF4386)